MDIPTATIFFKQSIEFKFRQEKQVLILAIEGIPEASS